MNAFLVAALVFLLIAGVGALAFGADEGGAKAAKRAKAMVSKQQTARRKITSEETNATKRRQQQQEALKTLAERERQSRKVRLSLKGQIQQAGLNISEGAFWIGSGALGVVLGLVFLLIGAPPVAAAAALGAGALGLPRWVLGFLIGQRHKKFAGQFVDAIDTIVRGVKSGLPLNQCIQIIANEAAEPLKGEFQKIVDGQAMSLPLDQNLQKLYERVPLPEVNFFNIVLIIQQKTGGNLAEALSNLSTVLRSRKLLREKIKAFSSEAKASASIIGSLPILVIVAIHVVQPNYIKILFTDPTGQVVLAGCALTMAAGVFVMNKMINFKF